MSHVAPFDSATVPPSRTSTVLALAGAALLCLSGLAATVIGVATQPEPQGRVAIIYPPGTTQGQALTRLIGAGGRLVRFGRQSWIVVAAPASGGGQSSAQWAQRIRAGGAWAVLNPIIAGGCDDGARPVSVKTS